MRVPDSFNVLPALLGKPDAKGRDHLIQQPNSGSKLALRVGDWKVLTSGALKPKKPKKSSTVQKDKAKGKGQK